MHKKLMRGLMAVLGLGMILNPLTNIHAEDTASSTTAKDSSKLELTQTTLNKDVDNMNVAVSGLMPNGATLSVESITLSLEDAAKTKEAAVNKNSATTELAKTFDIKVLNADGTTSKAEEITVDELYAPSMNKKETGTGIDSKFYFIGAGAVCMLMAGIFLTKARKENA